MIEKVLIFLLFLGPLIFFHELGHFFFARLFGVRVEVFSIGFGPKILKYVKDGTQYVVSIIPLGGYIKMFGDDPLTADELSEEDKKVAYNFKSKWARFWIVFGGPLANLILAFVIFAGLSFYGEKMPEVGFGQLAPDSKYYEVGVRTGDVLRKVGPIEIQSLDDFGIIPANIDSLQVQRGEKLVTIPLQITSEQFLKEFTKLSGFLLAPIVYDGLGEMYGVSLDSKSFDIKEHLELMEHKAQSIYIHRLEKIKPEAIQDFKIDKNFAAREIKVSADGVIKSLERGGYFRNDLFISSVMMNSAADEASLKRGDVVYSLNGVVIANFTHFKSIVQQLSAEQASPIIVIRNGKKQEFKITPKKTEVNGKQVLAIGIESGAVMLPMKMVDVPGKDFVTSLGAGLDRTWDGIYKTLIGFQKLVMAEVSMDNLGGPIAIAKVAADTFNVGILIFLRFMALISINLGIINLFPIPVLDGGHIVFIILEAMNRGPLSRKKIMVAQQIGMSLLFVLIFIALFNDISRLI